MQSYVTVYQGGQGEIVEKKSRFIAQVFPVRTEEEAEKHIEETRKKYWDARHHCYAFVLGAGGEVTRCSDDGEPSGTAGRPILEVLSGEEIRNALVIVTRYFGGTLLGTGGLARAYSAAARAGIEDSRVVVRQTGFRMAVNADYSDVGRLQSLAARLDIGVLETQYTDRVQMVLLAPADLCARVEEEITEATAGRAVIETEREEVFFSRIDREIELFDG